MSNSLHTMTFYIETISGLITDNANHIINISSHSLDWQRVRKLNFSVALIIVNSATNAELRVHARTHHNAMYAIHLAFEVRRCRRALQNKTTKSESRCLRVQFECMQSAATHILSATFGRLTPVRVSRVHESRLS